MDWIEADSTNMARFKYDAASQVLVVEFKNGGVYNYFDVPESDFEGMRSAGSKGQYLAQRIKGVYRYAKA